MLPINVINFDMEALMVDKHRLKEGLTKQLGIWELFKSPRIET